MRFSIATENHSNFRQNTIVKESLMAVGINSCWTSPKRKRSFIGHGSCAPAGQKCDGFDEKPFPRDGGCRAVPVG